MIAAERHGINRQRIQSDYYDHGWDMPKGAAAVSAAMVWDPETQAEPNGFVRRIGSPPRQAGEHAADHVPASVAWAVRTLGLDDVRATDSTGDAPSTNG